MPSQTCTYHAIASEIKRWTSRRSPLKVEQIISLIRDLNPPSGLKETQDYGRSNLTKRIPESMVVATRTTFQHPGKRPLHFAEVFWKWLQLEAAAEGQIMPHCPAPGEMPPAEAGTLLRRASEAWIETGAKFAEDWLVVVARGATELKDPCLAAFVINIACEGHVRMHLQLWVELVWAASLLNDGGSALESIIEQWPIDPEDLSRVGMAAAVNAATKLRNKRCLELAWSGFASSKEALDAKLAGHLARAAGECGSVNVLEAIINEWVPCSDTLMSDGHAVWGTMFDAASDVGRPDLIIALLRRLDEHSDPTIYKGRGTLEALLWSLAARQRDRNAAAEIEDHLVGLKVNLTFCCETLAAMKPAPAGAIGGRFEGAARCISKYLIGRYFRLDSEAFRSELRSLLPRIFTPNSDHIAVWIALLGRGQEAYVGWLRRKSIEALEANLGYLESLNSADIASEARRPDGVMEKTVAFINSFAPSKGPAHPLAVARSPERRALISFLAANQRSYYYSGGKSKSPDFFSDLVRLATEANLQLLSTEHSVAFLSATLAAISDAVWSELFKPFRTHVHDAKVSFGRTLEVLEHEQDDELIANTVRSFVRRLRSLLFSRPLGQTIPMAFEKQYYFLVGGRKDLPTTMIEIQPGLLVAASNGARKEVIIPLFKELRGNAETALAKLPVAEQLFEVSVKRGVDEEKGYIVLTIANAWTGTASTSSKSTGYGVDIILRLSRQFVQGDRSGYAVPSREMRGDTPMWIWRLYLPEFQAEQPEEAAIDQNDL